MKETVFFRSKRNTVLRYGNTVEKRFPSAEAAAVEAGILERLYAAHVRVPNPVAREGCALIMPYIPGETLPDIFARFENSPEQTDHQSEIRKVADGVINWLGDFYRAVNAEKTGEIRGDVNGRNFLWDGEYCRGIDFEERVTGAIEQDVGRLIAFSLTYDPPETPVKKAFADRLLSGAASAFNVDPAEISKYCEREFAAMRVRRDSFPAAVSNEKSLSF